MSLPEKIYTKKDVERAKDTAQVVGWLQGGGVVIGAAILWNLLGWIPTLLVIVAVGWALVKLLGGGKDKEGDEKAGSGSP